MAEYIEREVVRKVLSHELVDADTGTPMDFYNMGIRTLRRMIEDIPAADVQPVKHGRWVGRELGYCTCCGHRGCASDIWDGCGDIYYCPNCGARMDGEENV